MTNKLFKITLLLSAFLMYFSCDTFKLETVETQPTSILPAYNPILIPSSLNGPITGSELKNINGDTLYNYIRSAMYTIDQVNAILETSFRRMDAIENDGIMEFSYTGVDGNTKNVSILTNVDENGVQWDYCLEIFNGTFADRALKVYWNENQLMQKIILKPALLNTDKFAMHPEALVEIETKKDNEASPYQESMYVAIQGLNTEIGGSFNPDNIIVFLGQNNDVIDVTGSINVPNAILIDANYTGGRNWSFLAKVDITKNIAAAEIALPPSSTDTNVDLMRTYSIKQVLVDEIRALYPGEGALSDEEILQLAGIDNQLIGVPVYFDSNGYTATITPPSSSYNDLNDFTGLVPYVPALTRDYTITLNDTK